MIAIVGLPVLAVGPGPAPEAAPAGLTARIAMAAAEAGGEVQLIGKVGDDPHGDALLLSLARAGVGHVATLRDAGHPTPTSGWTGPEGGAGRADADDDGQVPSLLDGDDADPLGADVSASIEPHDPAARPALDAADVELALRYLPDVRVLVLVDPSPGIVAVAVAESEAAGSHLAIVRQPEPDEAGRKPARATEDELAPPDALVLAAPPEGDRAMFATLVGRYAAAVESGSDPARAFETVLAGLAGERATP